MFFFNDTATAEIYTLSLLDALPTSATAGWVDHGDRRWSTTIPGAVPPGGSASATLEVVGSAAGVRAVAGERSEEHTSELQSRQYLVCRLLLEKNKDAVDTRQTKALK